MSHLARSDNPNITWVVWRLARRDTSNIVLLLLMTFSTHSTCGVLCTVLFCLAGCARLPQNFSGCYCKMLEVKIKIGGKSSTRNSSYLIFGDSGSKSVDTGAVNWVGWQEYSSLLLCGVRMKIYRCCVDCRSEIQAWNPRVTRLGVVSHSAQGSPTTVCAILAYTPYISAYYVSAWRAAPSPRPSQWRCWCYASDYRCIWLFYVGWYRACKYVYVCVFVPYRRSIFQMWSH